MWIGVPAHFILYKCKIEFFFNVFVVTVTEEMKKFELRICLKAFRIGFFSMHCHLYNECLIIEVNMQENTLKKSKI